MADLAPWIQSNRPTSIPVVSISGGKDSTAVYLWMLEKGRPFKAIFFDTGNEHQITYDYVRELPAITGGPEIEWLKADFNEQIKNKREYINHHWRSEGVSDEIVDQAIAVLQPTGIPFLDLCLWKGRFPGPKSQFCTQELKVIPATLYHLGLVDRFQRRVLSLQGVRAQESKQRAQQRVLARYEFGPVWRFFPIFHWTVEEVIDQHKKHSIKPNPLYFLGMGRVGCFPCIHAGKKEIEQIALRFPEEVERVKWWQNLVGQASKRSIATFFRPDKAPGTANGCSIETAVDWATKTRKGGRNYDLEALIKLAGPAAACESVYGLCDTVWEPMSDTGFAPPSCPSCRGDDKTRAVTDG